MQEMRRDATECEGVIPRRTQARGTMDQMEDGNATVERKEKMEKYILCCLSCSFCYICFFPASLPPVMRLSHSVLVRTYHWPSHTQMKQRHIPIHMITSVHHKIMEKKYNWTTHTKKNIIYIYIYIYISSTIWMNRKIYIFNISKSAVQWGIQSEITYIQKQTQQIERRQTR